MTSQWYVPLSRQVFAGKWKQTSLLKINSVLILLMRVSQIQVNENNNILTLNVPVI